MMEIFWGAIPRERRESGGADETEPQRRSPASASAQPDQRHASAGGERGAGAGTGSTASADGGSRQDLERRILMTLFIFACADGASEKERRGPVLRDVPKESDGTPQP